MPNPHFDGSYYPPPKSLSSAPVLSEPVPLPYPLILGKQPWEQNALEFVRKETNQSYKAFCLYRDIDPQQRSLKAAAALIYDKVTLARLRYTWTRSHLYAWQARADAWDRYLIRIREEEIIAKQKALAEKYSISEENILKRYSQIAFGDPRQVMKWGPDGVVLFNSDQLSDDDARLVQSVKSRPSKEGTIIEVSLHDPQSALQALGKYKKMFVENVKFGPDVESYRELILLLKDLKRESVGKEERGSVGQRSAGEIEAEYREVGGKKDV